MSIFRGEEQLISVIRRRHLFGLVGGISLLWMQSARGENLTRYSYAQVHMGVEARLTVYAPSESAAERACAAAYRRMAALEDIMSDYRPTSELMRLCARAGGPPVKVSPELFTVLSRAQELSQKSRGAFDVTVGPYVRLWREARKTRRLPSPAALRAARKLVGWRKVRLDPRRRTVRLLVPGMRLDLGGIAKGYAGDEAIRVLWRNGIARAMFEAGGDIVTGGPPPGRGGWRIEVADRGRDWIGSVPEYITLKHAALSSSGDTAQFVEIGGRRYSHIVDPRTGLGLTDRIAVSVLAPNGSTSDGLSTTLSVLGPEKGRAVVRSRPGMKAWFRRARPGSVAAPRPQQVWRASPIETVR